MSEQHGKTQYGQPTDQNIYRTGSTIPPKSHKGLIAFLLGMVIFLCGISTVFGILNIHLLQNQSEKPQEALVFSRDTAVRSVPVETALGFTGETITDFWHTYHGLPRGVFIQTVEPDSEAARKGIVPGDIVVGINGVSVDCVENLNQQIQNCLPGETVQVIICRENRNYVFSLILDERN